MFRVKEFCFPIGLWSMAAMIILWTCLYLSRLSAAALPVPPVPSLSRGVQSRGASPELAEGRVEWPVLSFVEGVRL
jgi:multidrug efflux pump subunit AcrA (membrane-fusion protein)